MRKERFAYQDFAEEIPIKPRLCDQKGCESLGEFRAPKSPGQLREYYWFCLDHVREYNKAWDFYKGMSPAEIEKSRVSDITWNRPSWPVGGWRALFENAQYLDGVEPFLNVKPQQPSVPHKVQKALGVLNLMLPLTLENLKKQYKSLAKRHHPDLNPGDKLAEDRLKDVNEAYQVIKKHLAF